MSRGYADRWHDPAEPSWVVEPTTEWHPQFPGQRYPGDIGIQHTPPPAPRGRAAVVGRAEVPPLAPTRSDGTYLGRSWEDEPDGWDRHRGRDGRRYDDDPYRPGRGEPGWPDDRQRPAPNRRDEHAVAPYGVDGGRAAPRDHDRYDDRAPRQEPPGRGRSGVAPVSPASQSEPGWLAEPDEDLPARRPAAHDRSSNGHEQRPAEGTRRPRYQWDRAGDERERPPAEQRDRFTGERRPADHHERYPAERPDRFPAEHERFAAEQRERFAAERRDRGPMDRAAQAGRWERPDRGAERPYDDAERRLPERDEHRRSREAAARAEPYPDRRPREEVRPEFHREPPGHPPARPEGGLPWPAPGPMRPGYDRSPGHHPDPRPERRRPAEPAGPSRGDRYDAA
ncbi:hypothetical protein DLJ47_09970, partial [Micromonospora sp. S4605]